MTDLNEVFATNHRPTDAELLAIVADAGIAQALHDRFLLIERQKVLDPYDVEEETLRRAAERLLEELLGTVRAGGDAKPAWSRYSAALSALMAHIAGGK